MNRADPMTSAPRSYREAGVNLAEVKASHELIAELAKKTVVQVRRGIGSVLRSIGHYASLIDIGGGRALALHSDGVGTKVLVAQMMRRFDTVGIDCVALNVNDIICVGAEPVAFLDYLALKKADHRLVEEITKGLVAGAREAGVALVGGETAILPDVIVGVGDRAFDLAGTVAGIVEKRKIITGRRLRAGDTVIGVESSGVHSNGLTLARKVLLTKYGLDEEPAPLKRTVGEELLVPMKIYVKPVLKLLGEVEVTGLAHITGGAFTKLRRIGDEASVGFKLDRLPKPPPVFELIQREGRISDEEMYSTFNMGVGFCVCCREKQSQRVIDEFEDENVNCQIVGKVVSSQGVFLKKKKLA